MKKFLLRFLSLFLLNISLYAQSFPVDTSYTIFSTYKKLISEYPFIETASFNKSEKVLVKENLIYHSYPQRNLHLDLFLPLKSDSLKGVILIIHGGGWKSGNKNMNHPFALKLAEENFAAVTLEYRLSPEAKYPAAIEDISKAIEWIYNNADQYKFDTSKIALLGFSAGGTLAALVGTINTNSILKIVKKSNLFLKEVHAIIDVDGIVDFTHPAESGKDDDPEKPSAGKLWFGFSFKENPELWKEASPLNYVNEKTPPIVFINSSQERFHAGRDEMIEKLKSKKIYYEIHTIINTPHSFWLFHPWFNKTLLITRNFLDKIFNKR